MTRDRRDFLRRGTAFLICGAAGTSLSSLLTGCSDGGSTAPRLGVEICPNTCTGCGECLPSCSEGAIQLPQKSSFSIDSGRCVECGDCLASCEPRAIAVAVKRIALNASNCVGCGECVDVCRNEGGALGWEREYYSVSGSCRPGHCNQPCMRACPENAITREGGHARIDPDRCTRCGACVNVCPYRAILPARVFLDEGKCTRCEGCVDVCVHDALSRETASLDFEPRIDAELCNRCGACEVTCTHGAIVSEKYLASVEQAKCTLCGSCVDACPFDAIRTI
jgi:ferredoxin